MIHSLAEQKVVAMDLTNPASWFAKTRMMKRRIIAHMGPTNSGELLALTVAAPVCGSFALIA